MRPQTRHPAPQFVLTVDGQDITPKVNPRLISLGLTECREGEADQLDLSLSDHDGQLAIPSKGTLISLALGWQGEPLVDKGTFTVDEAEHSGAPDVVTIRARSAALVKEMRIRAEKSWHDTTLGAIVREIAKRHDLVAAIDDDLAGTAVEHVDQTHESDLHFLTRLAARYDAAATVKKGALIFKRINASALPPITITRADGDSHRYHTSDREAYSGVRAYWHDARRAKRRGVLVGTDGNAKRLKDTHGSEADALAAAKAEWQRLQRGAATFELTLALGRAELMPQSPVRVAGFKPQIDSAEWLVVKVAHHLADNGFTTRAELELGVPGDADN